MHRCAFQVGQAPLLSIECCRALSGKLARSVVCIVFLLVIARWGTDCAKAWQGPSMSFGGAGALPSDQQLALQAPQRLPQRLRRAPARL